MDHQGKTREELIAELNRLQQEINFLTKNKEAETLLKESEANARSLMESTDDVFILLGKDGLVIDCNEAHAKRLNTTRNELLGENVFDWLPKDVADKRRECINQVILTGKPVFSEDFRGGYWNEFVINPIYTDGEITERVAVFARDITDRKKNEKELIESHQFLKTIIAEVQAILFVLDADGVFSFSDGRGLEKLGLKPGKVVGLKASEFYKDYPEIVDSIQKSLNGNLVKTEGLEVANLKFDTTFQPVFDANGKVISVVGLAIDVTEAKQVEHELKQNKRKLATLMDNMPGMVYSCANDHNWTMKFISNGSLDLTGYSPADLIDNKTISYSEIIYPEDLELVWNAIQECLAKNIAYNLEYRIITKSGDIKHVWERGQGLFNHDNKLELLEGFITDISEMKRIEEELKLNYYLLRMAGKTARFGGWSIDLTSNVVLWSDEVKAIHEVTENSIPQVNDGIAFYAPEWREKITHVFTNCVENGIPYDEKMEIITASGKRIWIRTTGEAVYDLNNKVYKVQGSFQDINDFKLAEEALIKSESKFRTSIEIIPDAFGIYKAIRDESNEIVDFEIEYVNGTACVLNNLSKEEQIGKHLCKILPAHKESGLFNEYVKIVEIGQVFEKESIWYEDVYGDKVLKRAFDIKASKFGDGFVATWRDITERKKAEIKLQESEIRLNELVATKDKFFSIIAHDLKSPFNSIIGFSDLLVEQMQEKNYEGIEEYSAMIRDSSQRVMSLLMNLLEWSRSQTGRIAFNPEFIELTGLIVRETELLSDSARQKSIHFELKIPRNAPVIADKAMISTVLRNLISNAVKFSNPGGLVTISILQNPGELLISVADNGVGIKKKLFDKLFRIDENCTTAGTQNEKGTGLGLILCKEFIEKHGGKIWIESEEGKGSTVYFTVPKKRM